MAYKGLRFTHAEIDIFQKGEDLIQDTSIYDLWPGFPDGLLSDDDPAKVLSDSIDAFMEAYAGNGLSSEIVDGCLLVHCGGPDDVIQERLYDFYLVDDQDRRLDVKLC